MSNHTKSGNSAFERRLRIYEKYGLKPIYVHKTGAIAIFSNAPRITKGDKDNEKACK